MKRTIAALIAAALLSAGSCIFSVCYIGNAVDQVEGMRTEVLELVGRQDREGAQLLLSRMAGIWSRYEPVLAAIAPHDALHEITALIVEGDANLSAGDTDDFNRSMALLGEALRHLSAEEGLHISNIL